MHVQEGSGLAVFLPSKSHAMVFQRCFYVPQTIRLLDNANKGSPSSHSILRTTNVYNVYYINNVHHNDVQNARTGGRSLVLYGKVIDQYARAEDIKFPYTKPLWLLYGSRHSY